jgi:hypothetical protein
MRVVVPYVPGMLHARVVPAIERQGYEPVLVAIEKSDAHGYRCALEHLFTYELELSDICLVEQDIESRTGMLASFVDCPNLWCYHAYAINVPWEVAQLGRLDLPLSFVPFGHTRFRSELAGALHQLRYDDQWHRLANYAGLDWALGEYLRKQGYEFCRHEGDVIHHHDYDALPAPGVEWDE